MTENKKRYVIIGNSAAGLEAAETLRKLDNRAKIDIISKEATPAYSRCLISRFADGRLAEEDLYYKGKNIYNTLNLTLHLNKKAVCINPELKEVLLDNNDTLTYDKLLIAVGSTPFNPGQFNMNMGGMFNFHSLDDVNKIIEYIKSKFSDGKGNVVVMGAGFIGLEAAYALKQCGLNVTVVEKSEKILGNQFDNLSSKIIQEDIESLGVNILFNRTILEVFYDKNSVSSIKTNREKMPCDILIVSAGVRARTQIVESSGISCGKFGITVDEYLKTSEKDVYAAGDCIQISHSESTTGEIEKPSATWTNAIIQGRYAAYNMAGIKKKYQSSTGIMNALQFHRISAISLGRVISDNDKKYETMVYHDPSKKIYRKLIIDNNILIGMTFVGDISKAGLYGALISNRINIKDVKDKLLSTEFSHAYVLDNDFQEIRPYKKIPGCWYNYDWFMDRKICMGISEK